MKIVAIDKRTGERIQINDLYWFEENGVRDFKGQGYTGSYAFEFEAEADDKIEINPLNDFWYNLKC